MSGIMRDARDPKAREGGALRRLQIRKSFFLSLFYNQNLESDRSLKNIVELITITVVCAMREESI